MTAETRPGSYDFDVALSFAGENRVYVESINRSLKASNLRTFLDADHAISMWGEELTEYLDSVYRKRSRFAVLFLSRHYAEKAWPRLERRSAVARALVERSAYVLPVRLDDTEIDGIRPTLHYLDARVLGMSGIVQAIVEKVGGVWPGDRAPRTQQEIDDVLAKKPPGWEELYLGGLVHLGKESLEDRYRDYELGYADRSGNRIEDRDLGAFLKSTTDELRGLISLIENLTTPDVQLRAIGPLGTPGDPGRIRQLALRWNSFYEALLSWTTRIRGTAHSSLLDRSFGLLASLTADLVEGYRRFVEEFIARTDEVPGVLAGEKHRRASSLTLNLQISKALVDDLQAEVERVAEEVYRSS